jgi:hypothetical protein
MIKHAVKIYLEILGRVLKYIKSERNAQIKLHTQ